LSILFSPCLESKKIKKFTGGMNYPLFFISILLTKDSVMIRASIAFFALSIIAFLLGATGLSGLALEIAQILFIVFLVFAVISFLAHLFRTVGV
jgi:uncharacterized membrane protein YtjA (UPF0391 family)